MQQFAAMGKTKVKMEFLLKAGSSNSLWKFISTASGLSTWFADYVAINGDTLHFRWGKNDIREAKLIHLRQGIYIRFHWTDDPEPQTYVELRLLYNELTKDHVIEITDWAETDEVDDLRDLWSTDIEKLKRVSGL